MLGRDSSIWAGKRPKQRARRPQARSRDPRVSTAGDLGLFRDPSSMPASERKIEVLAVKERNDCTSTGPGGPTPGTRAAWGPTTRWHLTARPPYMAKLANATRHLRQPRQLHYQCNSHRCVAALTLGRGATGKIAAAFFLAYEGRRRDLSDAHLPTVVLEAICMAQLAAAGFRQELRAAKRK